MANEALGQAARRASIVVLIVAMIVVGLNVLGFGTLRVGVLGRLQGLEAAYADDSSVFAGSLIHAGLYRSDASLAPQPVLASSAAEPSNGGQTWKVQLRRGLTFHDGSALTAADVIFTYELAKSNRCPLLAEMCDLVRTNLDSVESTSEFSVTFNLQVAWSPWATRGMTIPILPKAALEASLDFKLSQKNLLITFHPVTLETATAEDQMAELLAALAELKDTQLIFTMPNADTDGRTLIKMVQQFVAQHPNARAYTSLGQLRYLSCIAQVDGVVGNSSSGLAEVPSFKKGTINIGDRQRGRLQAVSVINCEPIRQSIKGALKRLYLADFQVSLSQVLNPYGEGGASEKIIASIKSVPLEDVLKKRFYDDGHPWA